MPKKKFEIHDVGPFEDNGYYIRLVGPDKERVVTKLPYDATDEQVEAAIAESFANYNRFHKRHVNRGRIQQILARFPRDIDVEDEQ